MIEEEIPVTPADGEGNNQSQEDQKPALPPEEFTKCEKHTSYPKHFLCLETGKTLCSECTEEAEHKTHSHVNIKKGYDDISTRINNTCEDTRKLIEEQDSCHKKVKESMETHKIEIENLAIKVNKYYANLNELIKKCEKEDLNNLENFRDEFKGKMDKSLGVLDKIQEESKELMEKIESIKTSFEKKDDEKIEKTNLVEGYLNLVSELNDLKKRTKKISHETAWTSKIETSPNLEIDEKDWDFSEFNVLRIKFYNFTNHYEDFVDQENTNKAEEDEGWKKVIAERQNTFASYCVHDKEKYPTTTYCDKCNKVFCPFCGIEHKCDVALVRQETIKVEKKSKHKSLIESVEKMIASLTDLNKANNDKRVKAKGEYFNKLNEIATFFKTERMDLSKREDDIVSKLKEAFFDEQKKFDEVSMSIRMWKDALDCFLYNCKTIEFDWDCEDKNGEIYKPVRQLIQESRILCDQESDLNKKVNDFIEQCKSVLAFSFTADKNKFEEARKAIDVSVSRQPAAP